MAAKAPAASASLIAYVRELVERAVAALPNVAPKKLLVSTGWAVHDRVFAFVNRQARIVVKLGDDDAQRELLALDGAEPWRYSSNRAPPAGWLLLPETMHDDDRALEAWLRRAWELGQSASRLPRKKPSKSRPGPTVAPPKPKPKAKRVRKASD